MSSVTDRLIQGSMWLSLSRAIVNGLSALSTFVLAWYLAPADFGLVAIATTIQVILSSVTELSLNQRSFVTRRRARFISVRFGR